MFEKRYEIPTAEEILEELPMPLEMKKIKAERDEEIKAVLSGKSDKFLIIVGPCSAHDSAAMIFYANLLGRLQEKVKDKLVIVPRVYVNKSRTKGASLTFQGGIPPTPADFLSVRSAACRYARTESLLRSSAHKRTREIFQIVLRRCPRSDTAEVLHRFYT